MNKNEMIQTLYTEKNSLYHRLFFSFLKYDEGIRNFFKNNIRLKPGSKVLDAGCGSALLTKALFGHGLEKHIGDLRFYAFDITNAMLEIFKTWITSNHIENISLHQADVLLMEKLPPDWDKFDLVVCLPPR